MLIMSSKDRILRAIKRYPKSGVPNWILAGITLRYGARIKDLRDAGYNITTVQMSRGTYNYRLLKGV